MDAYSYIITTGWWCDNDTTDDRDKKFGSAALRKVEFFDLWHRCVTCNSNAKKIIVIDSASPVVPKREKFDQVHWVRLDHNPGHSTKHTGKYSGVTYAHVLGMIYALLEDVDYWVYVEQDALISGSDIVEYAISKMKHGIMFGYGKGTPQPMQQSFMIFRKEAIAHFLNKLARIEERDGIISPEMKFAIAASPIFGLFPRLTSSTLTRGGLFAAIVSRLITKFANLGFGGFTGLPFGYGRQRPIDFASKYFYFQHGTEQELEAFISEVRA